MKFISVIREFRKDESRTPLTPSHVKKINIQYPEIQILVQPSETRCFSNKEYQVNGAIVQEDITKSDLILGVKEVEPSLLIPSKKYIFFSHTSKIQADNSATAQGTPGMNKKDLLQNILVKKITLIDYENIRDNSSRRYLGFGRFAGIVGCYNSLNLYIRMIGKKMMPRAYKLGSYKKLKEYISEQDFQNAKIIVTGDGRVAKGVIEFLKYTKINQINTSQFNNYSNPEPVFCNLTTSKYVRHKNGKVFDLQDFIETPEMYVSTLEKYLPHATMLISAHYWDPKSPKLFNKENIDNFYNLKVIGDITCDLNGSIPTTIKTTTISKPHYYLDRKTFLETKFVENNLAIMAVDNLPSELPKDSSLEFGNGVTSEILPYIIGVDDGRINNATITSNGQFCASYRYLNNYINN